MVENDYDRLSNIAIEGYWSKFAQGKTYNLYLDKVCFLKSDTWTTQDSWIHRAKECLEKNINVNQALEILIVEDFSTFFPIAEKYVIDFYENYKHDFYYIYDIVSYFPEDHKIRKALLTDTYDLSDKYAIESLIRSNDIKFCEYYSGFLNSQLDCKSIDHELIDLMLNEASELGSLFTQFVSPDRQDRLKNFLFDFLENDKNSVHKVINISSVEDILEGERLLWGCHVAPYIAFRLNWFDVLDYLIEQDWYWAVAFDSFYWDKDDRDLLAWSTYTNNEVLLNQTKKLLTNYESNSIHGAIAWKRIIQLPAKG